MTILVKTTYIQVSLDHDVRLKGITIYNDQNEKQTVTYSVCDDGETYTRVGDTDHFDLNLPKFANSKKEMLEILGLCGVDTKVNNRKVTKKHMAIKAMLDKTMALETYYLGDFEDLTDAKLKLTGYSEPVRRDDLEKDLESIKKKLRAALKHHTPNMVCSLIDRFSKLGDYCTAEDFMWNSDWYVDSIDALYSYWAINEL